MKFYDIVRYGHMMECGGLPMVFTDNMTMDEIKHMDKKLRRRYYKQVTKLLKNADVKSPIHTLGPTTAIVTFHVPELKMNIDVWYELDFNEEEL